MSKTFNKQTDKLIFNDGKWHIKKKQCFNDRLIKNKLITIKSISEVKSWNGQGFTYFIRAQNVEDKKWTRIQVRDIIWDVDFNELKNKQVILNGYLCKSYWVYPESLFYLKKPLFHRNTLSNFDIKVRDSLNDIKNSPACSEEQQLIDDIFKEA